MQEFRGLPEVEREEVGFATTRLARLSQTMDAALETRAGPGTVTGVPRRGRLVHAHAVGMLNIDRETDRGRSGEPAARHDDRASAAHQLD